MTSALGGTASRRRQRRGFVLGGLVLAAPAYDDSTNIFFRLERTCGPTPTASVNYTVTGHL